MVPSVEALSATVRCPRTFKPILERGAEIIKEQCAVVGHNDDCHGYSGIAMVSSEAARAHGMTIPRIAIVRHPEHTVHQSYYVERRRHRASPDRLPGSRAIR